jgi:hypothetical protein
MASPKEQSGYAWITTATTHEHRARVVKFARSHKIPLAAFVRAALTFAMNAEPDDLAPYLPPRRQLVLEPSVGASRGLR